MEESARFRLLILLVGLALIGGWLAFMETARWYGRQGVAWHELPPPVRDSVLDRLGEVVVLEIERGPKATARLTYRIRVSTPEARTLRLWLAEDGTRWPPAESGPSTSESLSPSRD